MGIFSDFGKGLGKFIKGGGIFGLAGSLLGGRQSNKAAASAQARNEALQREFAQHGIRWRVADAKAAGLHPLYALGAAPASFSPVSVQDSMGPAIAEAGQNIQRSIQAGMTAEERQLHDLQMQKLAAEIEETDARGAYYRSEAARNAQMQLPDLPGPTSSEIMGSTSPRLDHAQRYQAVPGDAGTAVGATPLWRVFNLTTTPAGQDIPIVLPGGMQGDAAEVLESLAESPVIMAMVIAENARRYGPSWSKWFTEQYMGFRGANSPHKFRHINPRDEARFLRREKRRLTDEMR